MIYMTYNFSYNSLPHPLLTTELKLLHSNRISAAWKYANMPYLIIWTVKLMKNIKWILNSVTILIFKLLLNSSILLLNFVPTGTIFLAIVKHTTDVRKAIERLNLSFMYLGLTVDCWQLHRLQSWNLSLSLRLVIFYF